MKTAILLTISNVFMTFAWYGHLKFENKPLWAVIIVSWLIAFFEYCFQVPANRIGFLSGISPGQLKIMQEVITLVVFVVFARLYLGEKFAWNYYVSFAFILGAVFFVFYFRPAPAVANTPENMHHAETEIRKSA
ncbi:MAG TPA: DMT family protein [Tepidisphaeraceae bacterium]|nr:DMT family protein [Tepidisphaeraceae bacterium]